MPNLLGHQKQDEVGMELMQFMPLIKVNCSEDIHLFLCSIYVPMCSVLEEPIPPCRSLCESARRCEDIMRKFEHSWPENLECSKFPTQDEQICFAKNTSGGSDRPMGPSPPGGGASGPLPTSGGSYIEGGGMTSIMANAAANGGGGGRAGSGSGIRRITIGNKNHQQQPVSSNNGPFRNIGFVCPLQLKAPPGMGYQLNIGGKVRQRGRTVLCLVSGLWMRSDAMAAEERWISYKRWCVWKLQSLATEIAKQGANWGAGGTRKCSRVVLVRVEWIIDGNWCGCCRISLFSRRRMGSHGGFSRDSSM